MPSVPVRKPRSTRCLKDYVRVHRQKAREMFIPLTHPPGHGQADFGEAVVVLGGARQKVYFFAFDLPHSDACYIRAYPAATSEAWMDGHVHAFAFLGAVPLSVVYDNDSCLVARIEADGRRRRTQIFTGMLSHYLFDDRYGRPGKGNDKGKVEGLVGWSRRNMMVPVAEFPDLESFNVWLEDQCRKRQSAILHGHTETIGERLKRDLATMSPLDSTAQWCFCSRGGQKPAIRSRLWIKPRLQTGTTAKCFLIYRFREH